MDFDSAKLESILGRPEHDLDSVYQDASEFYRDKRIMITGALGSLGTEMTKFFNTITKNIKLIDIAFPNNGPGHHLDVTNNYQIRAAVNTFQPDFIFHFAADKHAPAGERTPDSTIDINIDGIRNVLESCSNVDHDVKVVFASTCKACNPETVYGATKLIGERLTLNAGHVVARYYNVVQSAENVFEIWDSRYPIDHDIMPCYRYFISLYEAIGLTLFAGMQDTGRFVVNPGAERSMIDVHDAIYGRIGNILSGARRGDRIRELARSTSEVMIPVDDTEFMKIISDHD